MAIRTIMGITAMKMTDLIDLHCHILPAIDDGSESLDQSIELAHQAVADGVRYILATPHHFDRHFINHAATVKQAVVSFQAELDQRAIPLTVFPGQEVHLNGQLMANRDDLLGIDAGGKYLLLELPHEMVPSYLDEIVFQLTCVGITPVIAHPERNSQILAEPTLLYQLAEQGCLAQVTATSLVGTFGSQVQRMAKEFVTCGLVQVVASDAHALANRKFVLQPAYQVLAELDETYPNIFADNARQLLNGASIELRDMTKPNKPRKFWLF